jgi:hypothetical protein
MKEDASKRTAPKNFFDVPSIQHIQAVDSIAIPGRRRRISKFSGEGIALYVCTFLLVLWHDCPNAKQHSEPEHILSGKTLDLRKGGDILLKTRQM